MKDVISRSKYQAMKLVNRKILSLYYGIGQYVSANSSKGLAGANAIETVFERLRKVLSELKGFSITSIKNASVLRALILYDKNQVSKYDVIEMS